MTKATELRAMAEQKWADDKAKRQATAMDYLENHMLPEMLKKAQAGNTEMEFVVSSGTDMDILALILIENGYKVKIFGANITVQW